MKFDGYRIEFNKIDKSDSYRIGFWGSLPGYQGLNKKVRFFENLLMTCFAFPRPSDQGRVNKPGIKWW